jgi:hypothetical protein
MAIDCPKHGHAEYGGDEAHDGTLNGNGDVEPTEPFEPFCLHGSSTKCAVNWIGNRVSGVMKSTLESEGHSFARSSVTVVLPRGICYPMN